MNRSSDLSAYLHIPFCERKCIYCDFYSIENLSLRSEFVDVLLREIDLKLEANPELQNRELRTIFFGGGTPSLLAPNELDRIIRRLETHFRIASHCEFTLECNPGTVSLEKLTAYKSLGVNRLSFGVQSFVAEELEFLGRIHDADEARQAIDLAKRAGFDSISLDLIFGLPSQTESSLLFSLEQAIALETDHISAYNLIVERGTPLFRLVQLGKVIELDNDRAAGYYATVQETLQAAGFIQYEISNYATAEQKRAKHNLVYWDGFKEYVSFGPSAHEFIGGVRSWNVSSLEEYGKYLRNGTLPIINSERLSLEERRTEVLYVQLRSTGVRRTEFMNVFAEDLLLHPAVNDFIDDGLMIVNGDVLSLTPAGYRYCDGIVTRLMESGDRVPKQFEIASIIS